MARTRGGAQKRPRQRPRQQAPRKSPSRVSAPAPIPDPFEGLDFTALDFPSVDPILSPLPGPSTSTIPSTPQATDFFTPPPPPPPPTRSRARSRARPRSRSRSRSGSSRSGSSRSRSGSSSSGRSRSTIPSLPRTPTGRGSGSSGSSGARRRLLLTNNPNFGPIQGQKRPGQKVTVTETRTVTTVRKGQPPRVRRESRRQNLN